MKDALGSLNPLEQDKGIFPGLSMTQRVRYFIYSFGGATACIMLAFPLLVMLPSLAAILISLSNLGYITATGLIVGFKRQLRSMRQPKRIGCVCVFLFSWIMTMHAALGGGGNFVIVLVFACFQLAAYVYYLLSYIPYGRKGAQKLAAAAMK